MHTSSVSTHTAPYAYSSGRSSVRTLLPHTATVGFVCVSDLRTRLPVAVCVGILHDIFMFIEEYAYNSVYVQSFAPCCVHESFLTHVIIPPAYEVCMVYSFRRFYHHSCMVLAHLSQCSYGSFKDKVALCRPSVCRPSVNIFNGCFSETTGPI